ncbi:hypothetical protein MRX96_013175 [Rhipicephalus microplus]
MPVQRGLRSESLFFPPEKKSTQGRNVGASLSPSVTPGAVGSHQRPPKDVKPCIFVHVTAILSARIDTVYAASSVDKELDSVD